MEKLNLKKLMISTALLLAMPINVFAADSDLDDPTDPFLGGDSISLGACVAQGEVDFIEFLSAASFSDGFVEGSWEPFVDLFERNTCQSADILNLRQQRDKIRSQIREAFLSCQNQSVASLKKAHLKVTMEIYYVRHILSDIDAGDLPVSFLAEELEAAPEQFFKNESLMFDEMGEKYFDEDTLSAEEFSGFYQQLVAKYKERQKSYVLCTLFDKNIISRKFHISKRLCSKLRNFLWS